jgi:hypothetical protein
MGEAGDMTSTDPQATASPLITADLARAGRALAQVSVAVIAARTGLEAEDVRAFERGVQDLDEERNRVLRAGLEELGVEFLPADDEAGVGYGVRQKFNPRTVKRIENWENEGGPALEDDI